ncbi:MAG: hypothetical protein GY934_20780 [Gammaproteobacteria bacterium]|nr:hypothetical protein [Gammaproteobacteria bacterium]
MCLQEDRCRTITLPAGMPWSQIKNLHHAILSLTVKLLPNLKKNYYPYYPTTAPTVKKL